MASWYPSVLSYREFSQVNTFVTDITGSINCQTIQIKKSIEENRSAIDEQTKQIVASNSQIVSALENGFNHLAHINQEGFSNVTSAIQALQSDLNYNFGLLLQRIEYQNSILNGILKTIQAPFETQVREYFSKACDLANGGILDKSVEYFKHSISLPTGEIFFPSHYQLGRLYLSGIEGDINIIDPKIATEYLLIANKYGNGIIRTNASFVSILADCKFFLSQSFYFQLTGDRNSTQEKELLQNAMNYGNEAVSLNPNLSQGHYFLAKFHAYANNTNEMNSFLRKAIILDRIYSIHLFEDTVFEPHKPTIQKLLEEMRENLKNSIYPELVSGSKYLNLMKEKGISQFLELQPEFEELKKQFFIAEKDFKINTYFGIDDCRIRWNYEVMENLKNLSSKLNVAIKVQQKNEQINKERQQAEAHIIREAEAAGTWGAIKGGFGGGFIGWILAAIVQGLWENSVFTWSVLLISIFIGGYIGYGEEYSSKHSSEEYKRKYNK